MRGKGRTRMIASVTVLMIESPRMMADWSRHLSISRCQYAEIGAQMRIFRIHDMM